MARGALHLLALGNDCTDLRLPIAHALLSVYEQPLSDGEVAAMIEALLPIELRELDPGARRHQRA